MTASPPVPLVVSPPDAVVELGVAFCSAKLLLGAVELGVFDALGTGPCTAEQLRAALGLQERWVRDFLEALVALGLLERVGDAFANSPAAARELAGAGPATGFLRGADAALYPAWGRLAEALRSGRPQADTDLDGMLADPARQRVYLAMMDGLSAPLAPTLAEALDWSAHRTVADVGGARGNLVGLLLRAHPHLRGIVFDRPRNATACAEHAGAMGVGGRVTFQGGDFFSDALPPADVILIGHVLADFSEQQRRALVAAAFRALQPGGDLLVYDPMPTDTAPTLQSLVASLHMLVMTPDGAGYRPSQCRAWMTEAGFASTSFRPLPLGNGLVVGRKAG